MFLSICCRWRSSSTGEKLVITLPVKYRLSGIITEGHEGNGLWVTTLSIQYTTNGVDWSASTASDGSTTQVYPVNDDGSTKRLTYFRNEFVATAVMIETEGHANSGGNLRVDLLGFPFSRKPSMTSCDIYTYEYICVFCSVYYCGRFGASQPDCGWICGVRKRQLADVRAALLRSNLHHRTHLHLRHRACSILHHAHPQLRLLTVPRLRFAKNCHKT